MKGTKRQARKEATRARVLQAAKECFENRDVREVHIQEIAARADTAVGSIYVHFAHREALMDAVVSELQAKLVARFSAQLRAVSSASIEAMLGDLASTFVDSLGELMPYLSLYASHSSRVMSVDSLRSGASAAPLVQMVNASLGSLLKPSAFRTDVAVLAAGIVSLWRGAAISFVARPKADASIVAESLRDLTVALLRQGAPSVLELDARDLARAMTQFLPGHR
jgi:AcrR family transcriptional regulator